MNNYNRSLHKNIINNSQYIRAREQSTQAYQRDLIQRNRGITYQRQQERSNRPDPDSVSLLGLSNFHEPEVEVHEPEPIDKSQIEGTAETQSIHGAALTTAAGLAGAERTLEHQNNPVPIHGSGAPSQTTINDIPAPPAQVFSRDQQAKDEQTALDIAGTIGGVITTALL
jgi:hypothetical protein